MSRRTLLPVIAAICLFGACVVCAEEDQDANAAAIRAATAFAKRGRSSLTPEDPRCVEYSKEWKIVYLTVDRSGYAAQYLVHRSGKVWAAEYSSCARVLQEEVGDLTTDEEYRGFVRVVLKGMVQHCGSMVGGTNEIPKYDTKPLPPDFESIIKPMWLYKRGRETYYVVFTYNRLGGMVLRHSFRFKDGKDAQVRTTTLGMGIGDAYFLE